MASTLRPAHLVTRPLLMQVNGRSLNIKPVLIAAKGDWPYLRKVSWPKLSDRVLEPVGFCLSYGLHVQAGLPLMWSEGASGCGFSGSCQDWWDMGDGADWRGDRPGPSPFKEIGNVFETVPSMGAAGRIKPDLVHTFHIGFGVDMAASMIVYLLSVGVFGPWRSLDDGLACAYSKYREFCHDTHRYTACDPWCKKKMGMTTPLRLSLPVYDACAAVIEEQFLSDKFGGKGPRHGDGLPVAGGSLTRCCVLHALSLGQMHVPRNATRPFCKICSSRSTAPTTLLTS